MLRLLTIVVIALSALSAEAATGCVSHYSRKHDLYYTRCSSEVRAFRKENPCPSTGLTTGRCRGYVVDHIKALVCGGADNPENMQWQTIEDAKAKDRWESQCEGERISMTGISSLPNHFALGLRSPLNELSWMTGSGVPWDYRYQYLNVGWKDWSSPAGSGNFAVNYSNDSIDNGYIPVYDWYILAGESPNIFTDLASTSYMATYYADFALLMQKI